MEKMCESLISIGTLLDAHDNTIQELYIQHIDTRSLSFAHENVNSYYYRWIEDISSAVNESRLVSQFWFEVGFNAR